MDGWIDTKTTILPLSSSIRKPWHPRRFSRLSWFSCLSSVIEGRCPVEAAPPLDLDRDRVPRPPLLEGDDLRSVKAAKPEYVSTQQGRQGQEERVSRLTAAPPEDDGAAELQESLCIETRSVD